MLFSSNIVITMETNDFSIFKEVATSHSQFYCGGNMMWSRVILKFIFWASVSIFFTILMVTESDGAKATVISNFLTIIF